MFKIVASNKFLKDLKLLKKRSNSDFIILQNFLNNLAEQGNKGISKKHKSHKLKGEYNGYWERHVKPDLLLIWNEDTEIMLLELVRTSTHADLFK